jgi:hypothetical protein
MTATRTKRRTAPELIAFHLGWDMRDVSEARYQPSAFANPAVYVIGNDYMCAPTGKLPRDPQSPDRWDWKLVGTYYGRNVYRAETK